MDAKTKKYLIIGGVATVVVALAGFGVHKFIKNRKNRTTSGKQKEREEQNGRGSRRIVNAFHRVLVEANGTKQNRTSMKLKQK